jgi:hypothetical protein
MILGHCGQIDLNPNETDVYLLESILFDKSHAYSNSSLKPSRISLENRWEVEESPTEWLDNLTGSLDALELELKTIKRNGNILLCLHSNELLLNGNRDVLSRFKSILERERIECVLSVSIPDSIQDENIASEYLASHIHYGSANGQLMFGALGPLVIDDSPNMARAYLRAQEKTRGSLLMVKIGDWRKFESLKAGFNYERTIFYGISTCNHLDVLHSIGPQIKVCLTSTEVGITTLESLVKYAKGLGNLSVFLSTGTHYKIHLKKYGGKGIDYVQRQFGENCLMADALKLFEFEWDPPKLISQRDEEIEKWVCDICGVVAKSNEQQNYTKHGFTYCSIACLSEHRKRNFSIE